MKKNILPGAIMLACMLGLSLLKPVQTSITGKVRPVDGALGVWVVSGKDTIRTTINSGSFLLDVKPGIYTLVIDAKNPYKDVQMVNLEVRQDQTLDVGEILLQP